MLHAFKNISRTQISIEINLKLNNDKSSTRMQAVHVQVKQILFPFDGHPVHGIFYVYLRLNAFGNEIMVGKVQQGSELKFNKYSAFRDKMDINRIDLILKKRMSFHKIDFIGKTSIELDTIEKNTIISHWFTLGEERSRYPFMVELIIHVASDANALPFAGRYVNYYPERRLWEQRFLDIQPNSINRVDESFLDDNDVIEEEEGVAYPEMYSTPSLFSHNVCEVRRLSI